MIHTCLSISPSNTIFGDIVVPGDKSISHRAIILASISDKQTYVENMLLSDDVLSTMHIMRALGVLIDIDDEKTSAFVHGVGLNGLQRPDNPLDCGNSGTSMRLLCGLLSGQKFNSILIGDAALSKRPMLRIAAPLRLMGAKINLSSNNTAPIEMIGNQELKGIDYELLIPSAQVKSGILLAGLYADGKTQVREKTPTRDHTERMLKNPLGSLCSPTPFYKGGEINKANNFLSLRNGCASPSFLKKGGRGRFIKIPGDISSAAFFIVLAAITKHADVIIRQVGVNPFRTGIIDILKLMGANITVFNETFFGAEPVADIHVRYASLQGVTIPVALISKAIDELPVILIAAATAHGKTILRGAKELRVKESDRIHAMCAGFKNIGVTVQEYDDGVEIEGPQLFSGGQVNSFGDHRIAMAFAIAGNVASGRVIIDNCANIATSFPNFVAVAHSLGMRF